MRWCHRLKLILIYVDNVLSIIYGLKGLIKNIEIIFDIKNDEYGSPTGYLGADVKKLQVSGSKEAWILTSNSYVKSAVYTVKYLLAEDGRALKTGNRTHKGLMHRGYKTELDVTEECDSEHMLMFQQLIGILQWAVELSQIDTQMEVDLISQHQTSPHEGHLEAL